MSHKLQDKELEACSALYKGVMERAYAGKSSPRGAIKAMCLYCVGYIRSDVQNCTSYACPLHAYRPKYGENGPGNDVEDTESAAEASE